MALFLSLSLQKIGSSKNFRLDDSRLWLDCTTCMYDSYNAYTWLITCMGYSYTLYVWLIILWEFWFVDMVFNCNLLCQIKGTFWNSCNSCDGLVLKSGLSFNITICTLQGVQAVGMGKEAQNLPVAAELYKKAQVVYVTHMSCMRNTYKLHV